MIVDRHLKINGSCYIGVTDLSHELECRVIDLLRIVDLDVGTPPIGPTIKDKIIPVRCQVGDFRTPGVSLNRHRLGIGKCGI